MGTLAFFPWLKLDDQIEIDQYLLVPYERGARPAGPNTPLQAQIDKVLKPYIVRGENPVEKATLLKHAEKNLNDELTDDEVNALFVFSELLAISGLSAREFFGTGLNYCNRDLFRLRVQSYSESSGGVTLRHRRRDGVHTSYVTEGAYVIHKPRYVMKPFHFNVDEPLLAALLKTRDEVDDAEWGRYYESIINFNLANTDSDRVPLHLEVVFIVAAFERLLGVGGNGPELASRFLDILMPEEEIPPEQCERLTDRPALTGEFSGIRELWLRDLYNIRNNMAHGKIDSRYPALWLTLDHLLLSSFVYPLTLKCKLSASGTYELTFDDQVYIDVFEQLACEEHLRPREADEDEPEEFAWNRIISDEKITRIFQHARQWRSGGA